MTKILRPYQAATVVELIESTAHYLVEQPTGSGKTVEIVAAAAYLAAGGRRVVIAATQQHIEQAFTARDYATAVLPGSVLYATIACPPDAIRAARVDPEGSIAAVKEYLGAAAPRYALACTHAALTRIDPLADLPADMTGTVLIVDEAHHFPAVRLSQVVEYVVRAGGRVLLFTATAFRPDGDPVGIAGMEVIRRTLAEHMEEGFAPQRVETEVVAVRADGVSAEQFAGEEIPPEEMQDWLVREMVAAWQADGRPKLVVRVPGMRGGAGPMVEKVLAAFAAANARVLDATGTAAADKTRFMTRLLAERPVAAYHLSELDVLVGVQRVAEGMDWPLCSTVYVVGLPRSLTAITQLLGRATRDKTWVQGYPAAHAGRAKVTFFVPCGEPTGELLAHHRRSTVLVVAHLTNSTAAAEWAVMKDIGRGLIVPLARRGVEPPQVVANAYPVVEPAFRLEALQVFGEIRAQLIAGGSTAPDVDVLELAYQRRPAIPRAVLRQVMVEYILTATGQGAGSALAADRVRRRLQDEINRAAAVGTPLKDAIRDAFEFVVIDLGSYAVVRGTELADVDRQLISLTGRGMLDISARLAEARPIDPDWLAGVVERHHAARGRYPDERTQTPVPGWPEESWARIDAAIGERKRSWPLASVTSLREFVTAYVRQGPMRRLLDQFRHETKPTPAEAALLDCLAEQRVRLSKDVTAAFGDTPVPRTSAAWPKPKWWVLAEWWQAHFYGQQALPPLADAYAAVMLANLVAWLEKRGHRIDPVVDVAARVSLGRRYADVTFAARVDGDAAWRPAAGEVPLLRPGKEFGGYFARNLASAADDLVRRDGVQEFSRSAAGYLEATAAAHLYLRGSGLASKAATGATTAQVRVPLPWVTEVTRDGVTEAVPTSDGWAKALRGLPGVVLTATRAA